MTHFNPSSWALYISHSTYDLCHKFTKKGFIATIFLILIQFSQAQIGAPGLSIGADEVLFEKGILDVELLGEIIAEKQSEIKQEFTKRTILNRTLNHGPYLTYHYASQVLSALLDHKDKNVVKKQLLESSTELAIVLGITEAFIKIRSKDIIELEKEFLRLSEEQNVSFLRSNTIKKTDLVSEYTEFLKNYDSTRVFPHEIIDRTPGRNNREQNFRSALSTNPRVAAFNGLPKIYHIYKMKDLGVYNSQYFSSYLNHILLDMFLEICRNNESLQRLGFFQKQFDEVAFYARSHYRRFLIVAAQNKSLTKNITDLFEKLHAKADTMITLNLEYASIILNQPVRQLNTSQKSSAFLREQVANLTASVFNEVVKLKIDSLKLSADDEQTIYDMGQLAYYGKNALLSSQNGRTYDDWVQEIKTLIPNLIRLNAKTGKLQSIINNLDTLANAIIELQFKEVDNLIVGKNILIHLAEVFEVLTQLDKAPSYDQVSKWIIDVGDIFINLPKNRLMKELSNLQAYLIVNSDENRVDVKVEDFILFLGEKYIDSASGDVSLYFTVGYNYSYFTGGENDDKELSYAAEKLGLKVKIFDIHKFRTFVNRRFLVKQKPLVNDLYALGYVSGLLYQIEVLKSDNAIKAASYGFILGAHFFNGLDFGIGVASLDVNDHRAWVTTAGIDIPITEYLSRLGKKKNPN